MFSSIFTRESELQRSFQGRIRVGFSQSKYIYSATDLIIELFVDVSILCKKKIARVCDPHSCHREIRAIKSKIKLTTSILRNGP